MSSRYQDRDRDEEKYSRDRYDRREPGRDREDDSRRRRPDGEEGSYRSPRRDAAPAGPVRDRSRSPKRESSDRYASGNRYDDRRPRGPNDDPNYRAPRDDYARPPPSGPGARGGYGGGYGGRGGGGFRGGRGGPGGGGYGGRGYGGRDDDYERPLDRRAIEEGRRRREEERARGAAYPDQGSTDRPAGAGSPYPDQGDGEEGEEEEVDPMAAMMGFGGFGSTKGKTTGQYEGVTSDVHKQRTWRQYMNRRGGFNRALDKLPPGK